MTYKVIAFFTDLQDNNRPYNVGDTFPHAEAAYSVTESRLAELSGSENKRGMPLIQPVEEPKKKRAKKPAEK
jgi:hypothetical protein